MTSTQVLLNFFSLAVFGIGIFALWPDRSNVPFLFAFPLFITSNVLPLLVTHYSDLYSQVDISLFTAINAVGSLAMCVGFLLGHGSIPRPSRGRRRPINVATSSPLNLQSIAPRVEQSILISCAVLTLCFLWMRVAPIFADEPLTAKFFRGEYKTRYDQVSIPYRFFQTVLITLLPVGSAIFVKFRRKMLLGSLLWATAIFIVSLNRGYVLSGILLLVATACTRSRRLFATYACVATLVYMVGSASLTILGLAGDAEMNLLEHIAWGAPDISDQLSFVAHFRSPTDLTYGLTFIGGLVPSNFHYNPAVFTLSIANETSDVSDISSGGFRLTPALHGYIAFSWIGVVLVPLISGILTALVVKKVRRQLTGDLLVDSIVFQKFFVIYSLAINFYATSYLTVLAAFILNWALTVPRVRRSKQRQLSPEVTA